MKSFETPFVITLTILILLLPSLAKAESGKTIQEKKNILELKKKGIKKTDCP